MKLMIQTKVEPSEAEKFIRQMSMQGYEVGTETSADGQTHHYHFILNGKTSLNHAVNICYGRNEAFIGTRPA